MNSSLQNKRILIVGGSSGIGLAVAKKVYKSGGKNGRKDKKIWAGLTKTPIEIFTLLQMKTGIGKFFFFDEKFILLMQPGSKKFFIFHRKIAGFYSMSAFDLP